MHNRAMSFRDEFMAQIARYGERHRVASFKALCGHLVALLSDDEAFCALFEQAWQGRAFHEPAHRPLLVLDVLRYDALLTGQDHPLYGALASPPDPDRATQAALAAALSRKDFWRMLKNFSIQTNETSRALVWLWPAKLAGCDHGRRALALLDIGASAGLNLVCDALPAIWTRGDKSLAVVEKPRVIARLGIDQNPLDATQRLDALWLEACIWPGEETRLARLHAAIAAWKAAQAQENAPRLQRADMRETPELLELMSKNLPHSTLLLAYQSIAKEYMDAAARRQFEEGMLGWLLTQPPGRALWIEMENAVNPVAPYYVAITAHFRAGVVARSLELGRCGFHPTDVQVNENEVAEFLASFT